MKFFSKTKKSGDEENLMETVTEESPLVEIDAAAKLTRESVTEKDQALLRDYDEGEDESVKYVLIFVLFYFLVGILAFTVVFEQWTVVDSLYFSMVTFSTVGYGDVYPHTDDGRLFCIFYSILGIIAVGIVLGKVGGTILDRQKAAFKDATNQILETLHLDDDDDDHDGNDASLRPAHAPPPPPPSEFSIHGKVFQSVLATFITFLPSIAIIIALGVFFGHLEEWTWIQTLYFVTITSTTTGYGDIHADRSSTKLLSLVFIPLSVGIMGAFLGSVTEGILSVRAEREERKFFERHFNLADFLTMDKNDDGVINRGEFLAFMLVKMHKVDQDTINDIYKLFDRLDVTDSDTLTKKDVELLGRRVTNKRKSIQMAK